VEQLGSVPAITVADDGLRDSPFGTAGLVSPGGGLNSRMANSGSIGFTTVVGGLYPEMIRAAKTGGGEMHSRRRRSRTEMT